MDESITRFFLSRATVFDIKAFCESNGYYLEVLDSKHFRFMREEER